MTPETDDSCTGDATQRCQLSATVAHGQIHVTSDWKGSTKADFRRSYAQHNCISCAPFLRLLHVTMAQSCAAEEFLLLQASHLMPAPKGCMRLALLPPDGAASISRSLLSDSFLPFVAELAACLAV